MKKILISFWLVFCGIMVFSQIYPDLSQTAPNVNQPSPNLSKTAYTTNLTGKVMQAYPNPATDQVIIQHIASTERGMLYVVSPEGRVLQQRVVMPNTLQTQLNVSMLNKGIYIVKYDDSKGDVRTMNLVKN